MCFTLLTYSPKPLLIENERIELVSEIKDLGILFDDKLSFRSHLNNIIKKLNIRLGIVARNIYY